jgi:hypothetical protein
MKRTVQAIVFSIMGFSVGGFILATPTHAAMSEAEQIALWRSQLNRAYCTANWSEALSLAGAMMGSDVSPHERIWLSVLRQDMFNYQRGIAEFDGCNDEPITAGVTAQETFAATDTPPLRWQTTRTSAVRRNTPSVSLRANPALSTDRPLSTRSVSTTSASATPTQDTACRPASERDRRVANGTVSSRWAYEIWQDNQGFRTRYWQQSQTCDQARTTFHYSTQEEAYRAFLNVATYNESRGIINRN